MAERRCWNCDSDLPEGNRFCNACGSPVVDASTRGPGSSSGPAPGQGPSPGSAPRLPRYYASRYLSDPVVYVQEEGFWRSFGPGRASGGAKGEIPASIRSQLVEIDPVQGRQMVAGRVRDAMGEPLPYVRYAGFWRRFAAAIIDGLIVGGAGSIVRYVILGVALRSVGIGAVATVADELLAIATSWLYFTFMESSSNQATVGKLALGIVVTDLEGRRISWGRANGRYWSKFISALIFLVGYLMAGFTQKKQALHDMIAGTLVVIKETYR